MLTTTHLPPWVSFVVRNRFRVIVFVSSCSNRMSGCPSKSHPCIAASRLHSHLSMCVSTTNLCAEETSWFMYLREGNLEGRVQGHANDFVFHFHHTTIIHQVIVQTRRSRVRPHCTVHGTSMSWANYPDKFTPMHHLGELTKPVLAIPHIDAGLLDRCHNGVFFLVHASVRVSIANHCF